VFLSLQVNTEEILFRKPAKPSSNPIAALKANGEHKKITKHLPKGPIFWEGWVKFFHYNAEPIDHPTHFWINKSYLSQRVTKAALKKSDKKGYINIPTQYHFYATLMIDTLNIQASRTMKRSQQIVENVDTLWIDNIIPLVQGIKKNSIMELGSFPEGKCVQIKTNKPHKPNLEFDVEKSKGDNETWIICLDKLKQEKQFLKVMESLKFAKQEYAEQFKRENPGATKNKKPTAEDVIKQMKGTKKIEKRPDYKPNDGYYMLLQDWSQCTLKCGGGKSYQQWMCIPPKKGGRKCNSKEIRTKACNTQKCASASKVGGLVIKKGDPNLNKTLKPIIKTLPYASRRQRTMMCKLKESDVFYQRPNLNGKSDAPVLAPSRVVLNTETISLFEGDSYERAVFNFKIKDTDISKKKSNDCCVVLQSNIKQFTLCGGFGGPCNTFQKEWLNDYGSFKTRCGTGLKKGNWQQTKTKSALDKAMEDAQSGSLFNDEASKVIKKKLHDKELSDIEKKVGDTQKDALKVIKKELDIEKMIQQEMQAKALAEAKELLAQKKEEEKKKKIPEQAMKDRDNASKQAREAKAAENEIEKIKSDTIKEVEKQRAKLKNKIEEIKAKAGRRKKIIEQDINIIRSKVANELSDANKNGSIKACTKAYGKTVKVKDYCNTHIVDDINKNMECKNPMSFCYICCENEFGNMNITNRDKCYDECDKLMADELSDGEFKWK
jgi:hypothetical protein